MSLRAYSQVFAVGIILLLGCGCANTMGRIQELDTKLQVRQAQLHEAIKEENADLAAQLKDDIAHLESSRTAAEEHHTRGQQNQSQWLTLLLMGATAGTKFLGEVASSGALKAVTGGLG